MRHIGRMLSPLGHLVRRHDPDRFFCTLFAPAAQQETLFTLYAFNHELARAGEAATEPGLVLIRLQWWREVVEGAARRHEVATPLHAAIGSGALHAPALLDMIAMREAEAEGVATVAQWQDLQLRGPGALAVESGRVLGVESARHARLRQLGAGYGVAGWLRNLAFGAGRLPDDLAAAEPQEIVRRILPIGKDLLGRPEKWPRLALAATLPAIFARRDLARLPAIAPHRGLPDRLATGLAAIRGHA